MSARGLSEIRADVRQHAKGPARRRIRRHVVTPDRNAIASVPLITAFGKIRNHFGVRRISRAGALAALGDQGHLDRVRGQVAAARESIGKIARENGLVAGSVSPGALDGEAELAVFAAALPAALKAARG